MTIINALLRRLALPVLLAGIGSFSLTCGALADVGAYAPAPIPLKQAEPAPHLYVDEPLPETLARGLAVIRYRTENLRILPVFGTAALDVSPRIGHIHVTVDEAPWHLADASGAPLIIQGLPAGRHKVRLDLATPAHEVIESHTVDFVIPAKTAEHH